MDRQKIVITERQVPPSAVPERATKKALLALQSELRRLERTLREKEEQLTEWEAHLAAREHELELQDFEDWQECDEECECTSAAPEVIPTLTGDSTKWLEKLFTLKDKRKK